MDAIFSRLKGGILRAIRKILGTQQPLDNIDRLTRQSCHQYDKITKQMKAQHLLLTNQAINQSFNDAYALYSSLYKADGNADHFNKDNFDALLLVAMCFSESTQRYAKLTRERGIFTTQWLKTTPGGESYLNIRGVKLTGNIPDTLCGDIPVFNLIFQRSLLVHAFFDDNHDKGIVETLDRNMGEGVKGYTDGDFDVTVKEGDIVIDAGAWIGDFSAYAAYKGATVYAFEPTPSVHKLLLETAKLNDGKIFPEIAALSDNDGMAQFASARNPAANRITNDDIKTKHETITIKTISLDSFARENNIPRIDFIKADIEGGERALLRGATEVLKKFAPRLAIAIDHLPDDPIVLKDIILQANPDYTIVQLRTVMFAQVVRP